MSKKQIYGYLFAIALEKGEWGFIAYAPGIQGVYEEAKTKERALKHAYESACAILESRYRAGESITEGAFVRAVTDPPSIRTLAKHDSRAAKQGNARQEFFITAPCTI